MLMIDQWGKRAVRMLAPEGEISRAHFLCIRRVTNVNRIYRSRNLRIALAVAWLLALGSAIALRETGVWFQSRAAVVGLGIALGGAAGNLVDIWHRHSVVDFIDLRWWPVFNFADVGIVGGLLLAFWP